MTNHETQGFENVPSSVFDAYDEILVPFIFEPYAQDVVARLEDVRTGDLLEVAAGTGAVTRALARSLPAEVTITATDLVPGMLARGERIGTDRPVTWRQADVMALPFASEAFDVVVCQFGVMFFNPKAAAFAEMRRVLRPGGRLLFVVWDGLDRNDVVDTVSEVVKAFFPDDPPNFIERTPHGYHDPEVIAADLAAGGFTAAPRIERVEHVSRAATAAIAAVAYCEGTPIRGEIEQRSPEALPAVIAAVTTAIAKRFGPTNVAGRISAQIVDVNR